VLATVALATMLAPLNSTMIAVALPRLMVEFGADLATSGWLVTAYLIAMACLQPVAGKLGDRFGRRPLIIGGLIYFGIASLGAATSANFSWLLFFRVQQAIAGAIALPNGAALVREVVPAQRRATRFGLVGAAVSLAAAAGPPLGGLLVELAGWQAIFYVNVALIAPALLLGLRALPARPARPAASGFDLRGGVLLLLVLAGTAGLLTQSRRVEEGGWLVLGGILLALLALFFIRCELRHPDPVLQPRFFLNPSFACANAAVALSNLAMYTTLLAVPILLAGQAGWSSASTGLVLTSMSATMVVLSPLGGRLSDRWGRRWPTVSGLALLALGLLLLGLAHSGPVLPVLVGGLGLAGIGLGLSSAGMQSAAVEAVHQREAGVASGIFSTSRYLGSIVGSSLLPLLCHPGSGVEGFALVLLLVVGAALLSVGASAGLHHWPPAE
jgi:EmrB/QacA subfamily drug resistance transporter